MFFFQHNMAMSDTASRKKAGQDGNNNAHSVSISLLRRLLLSALGGLIAYGILWSVATYPSSILLTVPGGLVLILAAVVIVSTMTSGERRKQNGKRGIMRNPLIAIIISYLVALTEIFMVREIEAPALTSSYYPGMKKRQKMTTTIIQTRNRTTRHNIGC